MKYDIFVSYRRTDRELVASVVRRLEERGVSVWYDADIEGGSDWRETIVEALTASGMLVIFFSEECNESRQLKKELAVADTLDKPVVPILIEETQPKGAYLYELADRHWIQAFPDPASRVPELVDHLAALAGKPAAGAKAPAPANDVIDAPANDVSRAADAYVGKVSRQGKGKLPSNDILPFRWIDLVVILPWLAFAAWRTLLPEVMAGLGGPVPALTLGGTMVFTGLAAFGAVVFPVRYFLRQRPVMDALKAYLISTVILLALAVGIFALPDLLRGRISAQLGPDLVQIGAIWLGFTLLAFLIYGVLGAQRALRRFRTNIRKI